MNVLGEEVGTNLGGGTIEGKTWGRAGHAGIVSEENVVAVPVKGVGILDLFKEGGARGDRLLGSLDLFINLSQLDGGTDGLIASEEVGVAEEEGEVAWVAIEVLLDGERDETGGPEKEEGYGRVGSGAGEEHAEEEDDTEIKDGEKKSIDVFCAYGDRE